MRDTYIEKISIDWESIDEASYLREIESLVSINELPFQNNVTFFVGENGAGKSTLIEAIAVAYGFNAEGGTLNYRFSTYDDVSELSDSLRVQKGLKRPGQSNYFFRAESFFNVASKAEEYRDGDAKEFYYERYGGKSFHEQSHGESFLALFRSFDKPGIFIMDEPEAALSPQRQLSLLVQIVKLAKEGAQFIIATHSPILLGLPGVSIFSFDQDGVHTCTYEETDSYRIMEMFINNKENILRHLLVNEENN